VLAALLAATSTPPTISDAAVWHVVLYLLLPLLLLYIALVAYATTKDRWKR
jgi:hypothetical protein